jgi:hypothetical protein
LRKRFPGRLSPVSTAFSPAPNITRGR